MCWNQVYLKVHIVSSWSTPSASAETYSKFLEKYQVYVSDWLLSCIKSLPRETSEVLMAHARFNLRKFWTQERFGFDWFAAFKLRKSTPSQCTFIFASQVPVIWSSSFQLVAIINLMRMSTTHGLLCPLEQGNVRTRSRTTCHTLDNQQWKVSWQRTCLDQQAEAQRPFLTYLRLGYHK